MRIIQEFVPGRQMTVAHVIANPEPPLLEKAGIDADGCALGIVNLTPAEVTIIAGDICMKAAEVKSERIDTENGTLIISGNVSAVSAALSALSGYLAEKMGFEVCPVTRT